MSFFNTWILLASALIAPEGNFLPPQTRWTPVNESQKGFLKKFNYDLKHDMRLLDSQELKSWASDNHEDLNKIAQENQLPITFSPFKTGEFGSLALLQLNLLWAQTPEAVPMAFKNECNARAAKGILFDQGFKVYHSAYHEHPVVKIKTKSGDYFCATLSNESLNGVDLSQKIKRIKKSLRKADHRAYSQVLMPQFKHEGFIDISWLNGLRTKQDFMLKEAVEYLQLTCDEKGCAVKAGGGFHFVPISVREGNPLVIDKPFYFWIERTGCRVPLVEGYINTDTILGE